VYEVKRAAGRAPGSASNAAAASEVVLTATPDGVPGRRRKCRKFLHLTMIRKPYLHEFTALVSVGLVLAGGLLCTCQKRRDD